MTPIYKIHNWNKHYENNRTREMALMRWVPFPNSHDTDGYTQMVAGPDGGRILGAFVACVQVASKCRPRGTLLRESGTPHDAESLARLTRLPADDFKIMLQRAVKPEIMWIDVEGVAETPQAPAEIPHDDGARLRGTAEEGRKEGIGRKEEKGFAPPSLTELLTILPKQEAEKFIDFYESKGWVVGKTKMKSWPAAARNWARRNSTGPQDEPWVKTGPPDEAEIAAFAKYDKNAPN